MLLRRFNRCNLKACHHRFPVLFRKRHKDPGKFFLAHRAEIYQLVNAIVTFLQIVLLVQNYKIYILDRTDLIFDPGLDSGKLFCRELFLQPLAEAFAYLFIGSAVSGKGSYQSVSRFFLSCKPSRSACREAACADCQ